MEESSLSIPLLLRRCASIGGELLLVAAANWAAFALRFDGLPPSWAFHSWLQMVPWIVLVRGLVFKPFGLYNGMWRYTSVYDLKAIVEAVGVSSLVFIAIAISPLGPAVYPRSVFVVDAVLVTVALCGVRLASRMYGEFAARSQASESRGSAHRKRVLVIGAGDAGGIIVYDMRAKADYEYQPVGFVDDDPSKKGLRIHGVPVLGPIGELPRILSQYRPDEILIAIPSADPSLFRAIVHQLEGHRVTIKTLPRLRDLTDGTVELQQIRTLAFDDLLARAPVGLDPAPLHRIIAGRRVLVTGAGGSIGGELCRQIAGMNPASLVMLDRYENGLHAVRMELGDRRPESAAHAVIGDVTDAARMSAVFERFRPEIVFHAAAHKHVPLMEENPCEAIKNNVTGTRVLAEVAERYAVDRFIFISTDKAVNPVNAMGASKRLAELVVRGSAARTITTFAAVRFGNVLGSNGSVVPRFLEQIRAGGPVTVTHPEVRRYFMLIPEAVQLVLHAAAQAENGAVYVLEMGEQVKLLDMARHLIRLSGFVPDEDIAIEFIGLRPGEKLEEELVGGSEHVRPSRVEKILRVLDGGRPNAETLRLINVIEARAQENDAVAVRSLLGRLLPPYRHAPDPGEGAVAVAEVPRLELAVRPAALQHSERTCPTCHVGHVRRARARTMFERLARTVGEFRLFTCDECDWRGWLLPLEINTTGATLESPHPDLSKIDDAVSTISDYREVNSSPVSTH